MKEMYNELRKSGESMLWRRVCVVTQLLIGRSLADLNLKL